jgi:uncharacterized membrane protein YoaK (UPF0700 family)
MTPDHATAPAADRPRRARHLIDPANPPVRNVREESRSLTRVQQWVMSTLAVTTILHFSAGLVLAAIYLDERGRSSQIGLDVIAGVFGVLAVAAGFAIHKKPVLTPWLLLGVLPGIVGVWLTLAR